MPSGLQYGYSRGYDIVFDVTMELKDINNSRLENKHFNVRFVIDLFVDYLKKNHSQDIESMSVKIVWNSIDIKVEPVSGISKYDLSKKLKTSLDETLGFKFGLNKVGWRVNRYYEAAFTIW